MGRRFWGGVSRCMFNLAAGAEQATAAWHKIEKGEQERRNDDQIV